MLSRGPSTSTALLPQITQIEGMTGTKPKITIQDLLEKVNGKSRPPT